MSVVSYPFFPGIQILLPYKRKGTASALCTFILENFWTKFGLKVLFRIPSIWTNFTCCKHLLSTIISHLTGPCPEKIRRFRFSCWLFPFQNF